MGFELNMFKLSERGRNWCEW